MKTPRTVLCTLILASFGTLRADDPSEKAGQPSGTVTSHVFQSGSGTVFASNRIVGSGNSVVTHADGKNRVYIQSTSSGKDNQMIVVRNGEVLVPKQISYKGKANHFWTKKQYDKSHKRELYWCPKTGMWFEYDAVADQYRPSLAILKRQLERSRQAAEQAVREAEQQAMEQVDQTLQSVDQLLQSLGGF